MIKKLQKFFNKLGFYGGRGATAYEFQFRQHNFRWTHLAPRGNLKGYFSPSRFGYKNLPYEIYED